MKIEFNKEQFNDLIRAIALAGGIYGPLGDFVSDSFKEKSNKIDELEDHLLQYAGDFGCGSAAEEFEGKLFLSEKENDKVLDDVLEYDDYVFWSELARRLAERDFFRAYGRKEIGKMEDADVIRKQGEIEQKYWRELEKYGIDRIEFKKE